MSVLCRVRARLIACVVAIAALAALAFAPAAGAAKIGSTYLALGDSLAYGFHEAQFEEELKKQPPVAGSTCIPTVGCINPATFDEGYVDDFGAALKLFHPHIAVINDGCPGETTESLIGGPEEHVGEACADREKEKPFPFVWLHHYYTKDTQLEDALAILKTRSDVSPITLDIGANDLTDFLGEECGFPKETSKCTEPSFLPKIAAKITQIANNVYFILYKLHEAAPKAQIVVLGLYNAYPAVLPERKGDELVAAFNAAQAEVAAEVPSVSFANPEPLFNPSLITGKPEVTDRMTICALTAMCPHGQFNVEGDFHPSKLGYGVLAGVLGFTFLTH